MNSLEKAPLDARRAAPLALIARALTVAEGVLFILIARFMVRVLPMRLWRGQVGCGAHARIRECDRELVRRTVRAVERAAELVPGTTRCLPLALALRAMLARRDLRATLRIGVAGSKHARRFHAWLEADGRPLTAMLDADPYRPFATP